MRIGRIRSGVILISLGIVFLLNNLGYVPWGVWLRILSLWPVILVAIGIEKIFGKTRLSFLTILSPLLFIAAILGPTYFSAGSEFGPKLELGRVYRAPERYQYSEDLDTSLTKITAIVQIRGGDLKILSDTEKLISAELDYWKRKPITTYEHSGFDSSGTIEIRDSERGWKGWSWRAWGAKDWEIKLTDRIPINLRIYAKASEGELDLSGLKLKDLDLDIDAVNFDIKLGDLVDLVNGRIESDASRLSLLIPKDIGLKIENHAKLTSTSFSQISILEYDNIYQTSNFDQASKKIVISLEGSVTRLVVKSYQKSESI
jgi:hypothetical protein